MKRCKPKRGKLIIMPLSELIECLTCIFFSLFSPLQMPMLDGIHVDIVGNALLPTNVGLQRSTLRSWCVCVQTKLGQYGGIHRNAGHISIGPQSHIDRTQLWLHLRDDASPEIRCTDTRQRICNGIGRKSSQSQSQHVVHVGGVVFRIMGAARTRTILWEIVRHDHRHTDVAFRHRLGGSTEFVMEIYDHDDYVATISFGATRFLLNHLLQNQGTTASRAHRNGSGWLEIVTFSNRLLPYSFTSSIRKQPITN